MSLYDELNFINALTTQMERDIQEMEVENNQISQKSTKYDPFDIPDRMNKDIALKKDRVYEKYSKLYIRNINGSLTELEEKFSTYELLTVEDLKIGSKLSKLSSDSIGVSCAALLGVLCSKSMNSSSTGKPFSRWVISSLHCGFENDTINILLFGNAHEKNWKTDIGSLLSFYKPKLLPNKTPNSKVQLSVNLAESIQLIGSACDFGICKGIVNKTSQRCSLFVNTSLGEYCQFHITSALKKIGNTRLDVQSSYGKPLVDISSNHDSKIKPFNSYNLELCNKNSTIKSQESLESYGKPIKSLQDYMKVPTSGALNLIKHNSIKEKENSNYKSDNSYTSSVTSFLKTHSSLLNSSQGKRRWSESNIKSLLSTRNMDDTVEIVHDNKLSESKEKAIKIISECGGIKKLDPNLSYSKLTQNRVNKEISMKNCSDNRQSVKMSIEEKEKIRNAKSNFVELIDENNNDLLNQYFDKKIFKEKLEDKARSVTEFNVSLFCCKTCNYKSEHLLKTCTDKQHKVIRIKATKRFFICKSCKTHTFVFTNLPTHPCKNCGALSYERTSMFKEAKGPSVGGEGLLITDSTKNFKFSN